MTTKLKRAATLAGAMVAGASLLALTACGGAADPGKGDGGKDQAKGTVTLWVDTQRAPALKDLAAQFKKDTGVEIKLVLKDFATADQDFISQVPTGKGPDIIVSPHNVLGAYVKNGVVAPLELGDKAKDYTETAIQAVTYEGNVYGVPYSIENIALLRNKKLVPEASQSFDEVIAKGKASVASKAAKYPFLVGLDPKQGDPYHLYPLQTSFGSTVFAQNPDGTFDASKLTLGDPAGVKFATALKQWGAEGILNANITGDIALDAFNKGESPYYLTGPWNVPAIKDAGIDYAIDPLPSAGGEPARPFLGVNAFFVSSKSQNKVAATKFLVDYIGSAAGQKALYEAGGRPPALTSVYDELAAQDPDIKAFGDIGRDATPMPAIPQMASVWADWGTAELSLIKGQGDPATVWNTAVSNIQAKLTQ